nr:hypothetical protein KPHV_86240 [Kitasatospora purpeofusca]
MTRALSHRGPRTPGLLLAAATVALGVELGAGAALRWVPRAAGSDVLVLLAGIGLFLLLTRPQEAYCERGECRQGGSAAGAVSDGG